MGTSNYSDEFKRDAVHQITVRAIQFGRCPDVWGSASILSTSG